MLERFAQNLGPITNSLPKAQADEGAYNRVIAQVFIIAAILSVLMIVVGGVRYAASQGNPDQVKQAKDTIVYAIVGLVITLFAYVIVRFVTGRLV